MKAFVWAELVLTLAARFNDLAHENLLRKWYGDRYIAAEGDTRRSVESDSDFDKSDSDFDKSDIDSESKYSMGVDMLAGIRDGQASDLWRYFVPDKDKKPTWGDTDVVDVSSLIAETEFPNQRAFVEQAASSANTDEGWFKCADKDGTCSCSQGKVRYGRKVASDQQVWTTPIELGDGESITCSLTALRNKRMKLPNAARTDASLECECAKREIYFEFTYTPSSFLEDVEMEFTENADSPTETNVENAITAAENAAQHAPSRPTPDPGRWCLYVPSPSSAAHKRSASETAVQQTQRLLGLELAVHINIRQCQADAEDAWTYMTSTGQIRHDVTGKCLTAHFDSSTPTLHANDCVMVESPAMGQAWHVPFYDDGNFNTGTGKIMLDYGMPGHTGGIEDAQRWCLTATGWQIPTLSKCGVTPTQFLWNMPGGHAGHTYSSCSQESQLCTCPSTQAGGRGVGEIRIGDPDLGETGFTQGVPAPSSGMQPSGDFSHATPSAVTCSLGVLQGLAVPDPINVEPTDNPGYRECQCSCPDCGTTQAAIQAANEGSSLGIIIGCSVGGALLLGGGGFWFYKRSQDAGGAEAGEFEEEGEYEEEEYEEYEEYEEEEA